MDVVIPLVLIAALGGVILYLLVQRLPASERGTLLNILLAAFALRLGVATLFAVMPGTRMFHDDAEGYESAGMAIAAAWSHRGPPFPMTDAPNQGYFYTCAGIYYVFGRYRVVVSYLNAFIGSLIVMLVYRLARHFFHAIVARRAAVLSAFIPSMILWSSVALKDTIVTFLIIIALYSCVQLKQRFSFAAVAGSILPIVAIQPIRFYMIYFLGLAIFASLALERGVKSLAGVPKQLMIAGGVVALLAIAGFAGSAQAGMDMLSFEHMSTFRHGMATTANSGFSADVDISTPGRALAFMPVGVTMLLFSPFPWQFTSLRAAFAAPEMFVWWALIPSLWRGLRYVFKHRLAECSPMLVFTLTLTAAYSLVHGNVGSGFRQRAQIFVFLFIFASLGVFLKRCRQRGVDPKILLNEPPRS